MDNIGIKYVVHQFWHHLAGLKENRNVQTVVGIALPSLEMRYVTTALRR
jgi:hypothetical protein